jgi:hypothetical protein
MATPAIDNPSAAVQNSVDDQKQQLENQVEESRGKIADTVADIKDAVADEYQSIKQGISDTFDWREQFRKHPIAWMVGALSVGYVLGSSIGSAYRGTKSDDQLLSYLAALGEKFTDELSQRGMNILAPALTGTILVPILTTQLKEAFGFDLSDLPQQLLADTGKRRKGKGKSKKKALKKAKKNRSKNKKNNGN